MIVYRSSATLSGKRGEGCTRRAATSAASERAYVRRLAARGAAGPFSRLDGLRRSFTTLSSRWAHRSVLLDGSERQERRTLRFGNACQAGDVQALVATLHPQGAQMGPTRRGPQSDRTVGAGADEHV